MGIKKRSGKIGFPLGVEIVRGLLNNAQKTKEEVSKYLLNIDPKKLLDYLVKNYDMELITKISFKKKNKKSKK